jgi:Tfp pilus assembly protein FimT
MIRIRKADPGFALPELIIIGLVMAIIVLVTLPNLSGWISSRRLSTTARQMTSELTLARAKAVSERIPVSFTVVPGTGYHGTYQYTPDGIIKEITEFITLQVTSGDNPLIFNARGMASNDTVYTLVNERGESRRIHVNIAGHLEIQ